MPLAEKRAIATERLGAYSTSSVKGHLEWLLSDNTHILTAPVTLELRVPLLMAAWTAHFSTFTAVEKRAIATITGFISTLKDESPAWDLSTRTAVVTQLTSRADASRPKSKIIPALLAMWLVRYANFAHIGS